MRFFKYIPLIFLLGCSSLDRYPAAQKNYLSSCVRTASFFKRERFVYSVASFRIHTELHIARVSKIASYILKNYPTEFPHINHDIAMTFISLHDLAKVSDELWIKNKKEPMMQRLFYFYGRKSSDLTHFEQAEMKKTIKALNAMDDQIRDEFLKVNKLIKADGQPTIVGQDLLRLEKLADLIDRGSNKVSPEEFARPMEAASKFLKNKKDIEIALEVEKAYKNIIKENDFPEQAELKF